MVDHLNEWTRTNDEIQGRLYRAAEQVDLLDRTLPLPTRHQLVAALRRLWAVADELAAHGSRLRATLNL